MPIEILSAMLAKESYLDDQGRRHIVEPMTTITVPQEDIDSAKAQGAGLRFRLEMVGVLVLGGGIEGEEFTLAAAWTAPGADPETMAVQHYTWQRSQAIIVIIEMIIDFGIRHIGVVKFKFLLNGNPGAELPLPVLAEDAPS